MLLLWLLHDDGTDFVYQKYLCNFFIMWHLAGLTHSYDINMRLGSTRNIYILMTKYNHHIDKIIVFEELYRNGENRSCTAKQLFEALTAKLKKIHRKKMSWTTLFKHLTILYEKDII